MKLGPRLILCLLVALPLSSCVSHQKQSSVSRRSFAFGNKQGDLYRSLAEVRDASRLDLALASNQAEYNEAVEMAVGAWMEACDHKPQRGSRIISKDGHVVNIHANWPQNLEFDELISAREVKSRALKRRIAKSGVGAPFVAWWKYSDTRAEQEPFMAAGGYLSPVTATISVSVTKGNGLHAVLTLHDPRTVESVLINGKSTPLAEDISAVGEFLLSRKEIRMSGLGALLSSENHLDKMGLIALERPNPDRVPVVFVHGLMSKPATWQNVVNELWSDPKLQSSSQFFFFRYPTGVPVIYSAAKLRQKLSLLHDTMKKQGAGWNADHMALVGHSMGGLVSKSQVQDSGDRLWVNVFGSTPDRLNMSAEQREALRAYLEYKPNPYISRVIFVATPHRGSALAEGRLGAFGSKLVGLPGSIMGDALNIVQGRAPEHGPLRELMAKGVPTSIDNLSPKSQFVKTSISLPLRPGLHVHSIIGNKKQKPLNDPSCSDGFVPYTSAHLDNVESELIVPFGHSAHEHPQAVDEIRRILHEHVSNF
ncbi:MAG: hypothetical protein JNJ83_14195 [Verrucomicrobiaceae bacterium]|nr:hypothetical protein [Verrucomicrobiaceae bacterium]